MAELSRGLSGGYGGADAYASAAPQPMQIPTEYQSVFSFLSGTTLLFFRTVLRVSSKQQRILRIVVVDSEGELCVYNVEGALKRQLSIATSVDNIYNDASIVVIKVTDDQDLVMDFHVSRTNAPEATLKRFLSVMKMFVRGDVGVLKTADAMEYAQLGNKPSEGDGGDMTLIRTLSKKTSMLLRNAFGSGGTSPRAAATTTEVGAKANDPPISPMARNRGASSLEEGGVTRNQHPTTTATTFKGRRDALRAARAANDPDLGASFLLVPGSPRASLPSPTRRPDDMKSFDDSAPVPSPPQSPPIVHDTRRHSYDDVTLSPSPSPRLPSKGPDANAARALVTEMRDSLEQLVSHSREADVDVRKLSPPAAISLTLQELRNDRISTYLDGFVDDMAARQREAEQEAAKHAAAVAKRQAERAEQAAIFQRDIDEAEARRKQAEALSALVLAACRRRSLILEAEADAVGTARTYMTSYMQQSHLGGTTAVSPAVLLDSPLTSVTLPPYLRRRLQTNDGNVTVSGESPR
jgi:hypothetical protein